MPKLKFNGIKSFPHGFKVENSRINVSGVGWVSYGDEFEVESEERAKELMTKADLLFVRVDDPADGTNARKSK